MALVMSASAARLPANHFRRGVASVVAPGGGRSLRVEVNDNGMASLPGYRLKGDEALEPVARPSSASPADGRAAPALARNLRLSL
jgi:hypothetical protein